MNVRITNTSQTSSEPDSELQGAVAANHAEREPEASEVADATGASPTYEFDGYADPLTALFHKIRDLGYRSEDLHEAVKVLVEYAAYPDASIRSMVVESAANVAKRLGIVDEFREIGRNALLDEFKNVRDKARFFHRETANCLTPEELAMQKKLPGLEFQLWLIRNDPVETEKHWHYRRIRAEEHKTEYAKMTKAEKKKYRQRFIRNDSWTRGMVSRTKGPDKKAFMSQLMQRSIDETNNRQRRAWVPRWLP